jgi:ubiquinone/menaquinone biosynthesis C-methylase UbiE
MLNWYADLLQDPAKATRRILSELELLSEALRRHRGRVLDVGGGLGLAKTLLSSTVEYTVLDPEPGWAPLRQLLGGHGTRAAITFITALGEQLPLAAGQFDGVLLLWTLNHVTDPAAVLCECARVLRRGGRLLLVLEDLDPNAGDAPAPVVEAPQPDHLVFTESQVVEWTRAHFVVATRSWAGPYLTLELIRESGLPGTTPPVEPVDLGDLRRVSPVSRGYGYSRGQPIDRVYIERFVAAQANVIKGAALEIGDATYARRYGSAELRSVDVLHTVPGYPGATLCGDLACAIDVAADSFDCIICTQTLQLIYDLKAAVRTLHRMLRPGGVLLVTVPGISQIDDPQWQDAWCWSFTPVSARRLFAEAFSDANVEVACFGNVLAATAFLQGISAEELTREEIDASDAGYPLLITIRATRRRT